MRWDEFVFHLCRNFGGKPAVLNTVLRVFSQVHFSSAEVTQPDQRSPIPVFQVVNAMQCMQRRVFLI